jgi:chorismate mutase
MVSIVAGTRSHIDKIDDEILVLLNRRAQVAVELAAHKRAARLRLRDRGREAQVLARARSRSSGPLSPEAVERLFRTILSESRRAQSAALATADAERRLKCA